MPPKFRVCSSQLNLVLFILIAVALTAGSAFGQTVTIAVSTTTGSPTSCAVGGTTCSLTHGQNVQFNATLNNAPGNFNPTINWSFSPTIGTLSSTGLYTAPSSLFQNFTITVVAYTAQNPAIFAKATVLLIPTVSISLAPTTVTLSDGRVVLGFNNTTSGRTPLNVAVSNDGEHFRVFDTLEDQTGEYSYPAVIQGSTGDIYITYTWNRKSIAFVRVPLSRIPR